MYLGGVSIFVSRRSIYLSIYVSIYLERGVSIYLFISIYLSRRRSIYPGLVWMVPATATRLDFLMNQKMNYFHINIFKFSFDQKKGERSKKLLNQMQKNRFLLLNLFSSYFKEISKVVFKT